MILLKFDHLILIFFYLDDVLDLIKIASANWFEFSLKIPRIKYYPFEEEKSISKF